MKNIVTFSLLTTIVDYGSDRIIGGNGKSDIDTELLLSFT